MCIKTLERAKERLQSENIDATSRAQDAIDLFAQYKSYVEKQMQYFGNKTQPPILS